MLRNTISFALVSLLSLASLCPAAAQEDMINAILSAEDSARLVGAARSDQAAFERFRRNNLPEGWSSGSTRCDERIGRFCLTHSSSRVSRPVEPEGEEIVTNRLVLIDGFNRVAELIPGDGWIAGQRIRYLVEAGRKEEAIEAARMCRAEASWCSALAGFSYHYAGHGPQADSAYAVALDLMEEEQRDEWLDLSLILDSRSLRDYRKMDADEKATFADRFWHLADPFATRPGNELFAEHLSRHVHNQFQDRARSPDAISWGWDLREILIRYGWPSSWERVREWNRSLSQGPPSLTSHFEGAPQDLLPPAELLVGATATDDPWDVENPAARTGYDLPLSDSSSRWLNPLPHQFAAFRRGDEAVIVAGFEIPADSVAADARVNAGVALISILDLAAMPVVSSLENQPLAGSFAVRSPLGPMVLSLETTVPEDNLVARSRDEIDLSPLAPGLMALSDLLLLRQDSVLPDSLEQAIQIARGSSRVQVGERVGIYWEVYGADPRDADALSISLRMLGEPAGWLRRLAQRAGLLREVDPVRLRWQEPVPDAEYLARSLTLDIPEIDPGNYILELSVEAPGREAMVVRKDIEVVAAIPS